ncbi:hypothetical protein MnTg02_01148 [bacterium MnTg02]|nr:hypothetical protein MnTg02_01148 [bacterium MnTg02]
MAVTPVAINGNEQITGLQCPAIDGYARCFDDIARLRFCRAIKRRTASCNDLIEPPKRFSHLIAPELRHPERRYNPNMELPFLQ